MPLFTKIMTCLAEKITIIPNKRVRVTLPNFFIYVLVEIFFRTMNVRDNNAVLAAFISVNKQLVALGEKDRLRQVLHERLKNSEHRTHLEDHVRQIIQKNGGVDSVNLETLVEQLRGCLPSIQEASGAVIESIIEFTQAQANNET